MKMHRVFLVVAAVAASTASAEAAQSLNWVRPNGPTTIAASQTCASFSLISETFDVSAGITNGIPVLPQAGEVFTISVSGPGTGSFRIVGDPAGTVTFAGPTSVPGTLNYTASTPFPNGTVGVGYYFDSGSGTVTLTATCRAVPTQAPTLGTWGLLALGAILAFAGAIPASRWLRARTAR